MLINEAQWILNGFKGLDNLPHPNHSFLLENGVYVLSPEQKRFWVNAFQIKEAWWNDDKVYAGKSISHVIRAKQKDKRLSYFNTGGPVGGAPGIDANPAMLTRGEYVINKQSAQAIGINNLNRLNSIKGYKDGGPVGYFANGGNVSNNMGFDVFSQAVDRLESIPRDFTMTLATTQVTVSINGAELLAQMMPEVQNIVLSSIGGEIEKLKTELRSGNV